MLQVANIVEATFLRAIVLKDFLLCAWVVLEGLKVAHLTDSKSKWDGSV